MEKNKLDSCEIESMRFYKIGKAIAKKEDMIDWLKWLIDDYECLPKHKMPYWAKESIRNKIEEIS